VDFSYSPRQLELQGRASAYVDLLIEHELEVERSGGHLDDAVVEQLRQAAMDAGLWAINMPTELGGAGLSILEQVIVQEQWGKATNCLWDIPWRPANVLARATPEQQERHLLPIIRGETFDAFAVTESGAGSDPSGMRSNARRVDGGWLLSGEKWYVTCGDLATLLLVQANAGEAREPTLFLVDKAADGVEIVDVPPMMHTPLYQHPTIRFTDVFVADDDVLGGVGEGYELTKDWFTDERIMIAARTTGAAERALGLARDWAIEREQFGHPIASYQMVQAMLADSAAEIAVNRAYTYQVAWEADRGADRKTLHAKASIAKLSASEAAGRVIDRCVQIFGGRGYRRDHAVERLYRELRVDRIWEGTSEIQRLIIANELVKRGTGVLTMPAG
jgi:acyl-CoA dehydrogenase